MSRSYRSQKESVTAARLIRRTADGSLVLPRIVERAPTPGDLHPLNKRALRRLLQRVPVEFIHGLSRIELRARESPLIGDPFGCYWPDERAIVLYSLPPVFHCRSLSVDFARSLRRFYADIQSGPEGFTVSWREPAVMSLWFYSYVVTHELGHHFVEQYKSKNSRIGSIKMEELVADLHAKRLTDELLASFRKRRSA
jgi:hypothetical protein